MKRHYISGKFAVLFLLGLTFVFSCDTANNVEDPDLDYFVKFYGGDGDQFATDMLVLNDGSFLLLGSSSVNDLQSSIYVVRVNAEGDVMWEKTFEGGFSVAKDVEPTVDGNFIILADHMASGVNHFDVQLMKISPTGDLLASTTKGTPAHEHSHTVTSLVLGDFIVSGTSEFTSTWVNPNDPNPDLGDVFNYRFSPGLDELPSNGWSPSIHGWGSNLDVAVKTMEISNKLFYVFGYTNSSFEGHNPEERLGLFYFSRDSTGGTINASFATSSTDNTQINLVERVPSELGGGFVAIGSSTDEFGFSTPVLARLRESLTFDPKGNDVPLFREIPFGRNISGIRGAPSLIGEYGFLILGNERRSIGTNFWLSKIDQSGTVIWSASFGSEGEDDSAASLVQLPDGKIVILGTIGMPDSQYKMALIKINPRGQLLK